MILCMERDKIFKRLFYFLKTRYIYLRGFRVKEISDSKSIPIIINNFNRVTTLKELISFLEKRGYKNIFIIDNASTYPPLLEYYKQTPYKVFMLDKNIGYKALWRTPIYKQFQGNLFVYTDSDVVPCEECKDDFMDLFRSIMKRHPFATKVGFGLRIDDLPDHFSQKQSVIEWEKRHWEIESERDLFRAPIDTTFALYRPYTRAYSNWYIESYRTGGSYVARHIPWYTNSANPSQEELYYIKSCIRSSHWTAMQQSEFKIEPANGEIEA